MLGGWLRYFYYAANGGKSTVLLQSAYNYRERGMEVAILTSTLDNRDKTGYISSRIGLRSKQMYMMIN